jgi:hypothetical protein
MCVHIYLCIGSGTQNRTINTRSDRCDVMHSTKFLVSCHVEAADNTGSHKRATGLLAQCSTYRAGRIHKWKHYLMNEKGYGQCILETAFLPRYTMRPQYLYTRTQDDLQSIEAEFSLNFSAEYRPSPHPTASCKE